MDEFEQYLHQSDSPTQAPAAEQDEFVDYLHNSVDPKSPTPESDSALQKVMRYFDLQKEAQAPEQRSVGAKVLTGLGMFVKSAIPQSWDQARQMATLPMPSRDVPKIPEENEQWRKEVTGELGLEQQVATIAGTAAQALPLAHLPFAESPLRPTPSDLKLVEQIKQAQPETAPAQPTSIEAEIKPQGGDTDAIKPDQETSTLPTLEGKPPIEPAAVEAKEGDTRDTPAEPGPASESVAPAPQEEPDAQGTGITVGAASKEEYMRRYQLIGASKLMEGHTELGAWSAEMMKDEPSIPKDDLATIFERSKQVINDMETAGKGTSEIQAEIKRQTGQTRPQETPRLVKPLAALKTVYQAAEQAGKAGYKRGSAEQRAAGQAALNQMQSELSAADKWMAGDQEQVRRNMVDFVEHVLPREERGRFINQITAALKRPPIRGGDPSVMYKNAFKVMEKIGDRAKEMWKEDLRSEITGLRDDILKSSGVSVEAKDLFRERTSGISFDKKITPSSAARLAKFENLPQYLREKLDDFSRTPLKELSQEELEALRDDAWMTRKVGRQQWQDLKTARETEMNVRAADLAESKTKPVEQWESTVREGSTSAWTRFKDGIYNTIQNSLGWASLHEKSRLFIPRLFETLDGHQNGWLTRNVLRPFYTKDRMYRADYNPIRDEAIKIADRNKLTADDYMKVGIHAHAMQDGTEAELFKYTGEPEKLRSMLEDYKKNGLNKGQQELYDYFRKTLDDHIPALKKFFADNYNKELQFYDNYFPRRIDPAKSKRWRSEREKWTHPVTGEVVDVNNVADTLRNTTDYQFRIRSVRKGFSKARIEGAEIPVNLNAMDVFLRHMDDWLYVKNLQPHLNMVGRLANTDLFATKYGHVGKGMVLDFIDALARRGQYSRNVFERGLDSVKNKAMTGVLGFRLNQFKHFANYPLGMFEAGGPSWWARGVQIGLHTPEGRALVQKLWPETLRASAGDVSIREAAQQGKSSRAAFAIDRQLDLINRVGTALGSYLRQADEAGFNWEDWQKIPLKQGWANKSRQAYVNAVGSAEVMDRPLIVTKGTSIGSKSLGQALMAYQTPKMIRWGTLRSSLIEDAIREKRFGKSAAKLTLTGLGSLLESGVKFGSRAAYVAAASGILSILGFNAYKRQQTPAVSKQLLNEALADMTSVVPGGSIAGKAIAVSEYPQAKRQILMESGVPPLDFTLNTLADAEDLMFDRTGKQAFRLGMDLTQQLGIPVSTPMSVVREAMKQTDPKAQHRADMAELKAEGFSTKKLKVVP